MQCFIDEEIDLLISHVKVDVNRCDYAIKVPQLKTCKIICIYQQLQTKPSIMCHFVSGKETRIKILTFLLNRRFFKSQFLHLLSLPEIKTEALEKQRKYRFFVNTIESFSSPSKWILFWYTNPIVFILPVLTYHVHHCYHDLISF